MNGSVNGNGSTTSAWFEWGTNSNLGNSTSSNGYGTGSTNFSATISGLSANTTYHYRAMAQGSQGVVQGNIVTFTTNSSIPDGQVPTVTTNSASNITQSSATLNGWVNGNGLSTSVWFEYGPTTNFGSVTSQNSYGTGFNNFSSHIAGLNSNTTYYFRAVGQNSRGIAYGQTLNFSTGQGGGGQTQTAPTAITTPATNIANNSALLNSLILNPSGVNAAAWFEWGTSTNLGNTTLSNSVGTSPSVTHSAQIFNLVPGTTYYFRAVAENSYGRSQGSILSFVATGTINTGGGGSNTTIIYRPPVSTTTVINQGGGVGVPSLVMLTIDGGSDIISPGERRGYHVTWRNVSNQILRKVVVRVLLPGGMNFQSADKGSFTASDNTLTYDIGTLVPGQTGDLFMVADASITLQPGTLVVVVANLVYTDQSNVQGNAIAYATHTVSNTSVNNLGASFFSAGTFWPGSLFGWLLLILILLLIAWLISRLVAGTRTRTVTRIEEI